MSIDNKHVSKSLSGYDGHECRGLMQNVFRFGTEMLLQAQDFVVGQATLCHVSLQEGLEA